MADLLSEQIVAAIAAAVTGLPTCGANVFVDQNDPLDDSHSPAIVINTPTEGIETTNLPAPRIQTRTLTVVLTVYAKAATPRPVMKAAQKEIEIALAMPNPGIPARILTLTNVTVDYDRSTEKPVGQAALTYAVTYYCAEHAPDVAQ